MMKKILFLLPTIFLSTLSHADSWTAWLDRDLPGGNGDYESRADYPAGSVCASPAAVEGRYLSGNSWVVITPGTAASAPNYLRTFSPAIGLVCNNDDQISKGKPACINYQARFKCGSISRNDLSVKYPGLIEIDKQNAEYSKTSPGFVGRNVVSVARAASVQSANAKTSATAAADEVTPVEDNVFHLGQGFDTINTTYRSQCLDQTNPAFKVISTPSTAGTHFSIKHIKSHAELYDALDQSLSMSAQAGFEIEDIDVAMGIDLSNGTIKSEYLDTYHEVFVAKYSTGKKRYSLTTQPRPIKDAYTNLLLRTNQDSYKRDYFSECGDRYVDGVELGANLYVVFYFDTKSIKESEKTQANLDVNLAIETMFSGALSQSQMTQINNTFTKYNVHLESNALGGPEEMAHTFVDPVKFQQYLPAFIAGINDSNLKATEEFYREYTLPQQYASESYFSVFADTSDFIKYAQKYTALMNEYVGRCNAAKEYQKNLSPNVDLKYCSNDVLQADIGQGRRNCGVSSLWDRCVHPGVFTLSGGGLLINKLTTNTPAFYETEKLSETRSQSVTGGLVNKKCISDSYSLCLASGCYENKPESNNNLGYEYIQYSYSSPATSDEQGYKNTTITSSGAARCVKEEIKACTRRVAGSKANFSYALRIWGVCPTTKAFPLD